MNEVEIGCISSVILSVSLSVGFVSHIGAKESCEITCQLIDLSSSGLGPSVKNRHHGFGMSPHVGSVKGRKLVLTLSSVNGKMSFLAILIFLLNQPITWVGFALISQINVSSTSITSLFWLMAHLGFSIGHT